MDALFATFLIILGFFLFLTLVLIGISAFLIFMGPPDLHDLDIDSEQELKNRKNS